ncbi:hypothetical protein GCM10010082_30630 [Kushneria pakistanensis]|uniref:Uncharacterized protein n=2 Tax=Kushneria pakistanensis TaxID=1508770 RepID=A0ABQ3FRC2_9GAMM|nr:hypothetical protein GCM10010082_30630 [Kushneria pakistanensis]
MAAFCFLLLGLFTIVLISFTWSYQNLTAEDYVAALWFEPAAGHSNMDYMAHLSTDQDHSDYGSYKIMGDQWRLDARFLKMRWMATAFVGKESRYALSRLEGRYSNINDANHLPHMAHNIDDGGVLESFSIFGFNIFADINYGSSIYQDIRPNTLYTVYKTTTGLLVRQTVMHEEKTPKNFWQRLIGL